MSEANVKCLPVT